MGTGASRENAKTSIPKASNIVSVTSGDLTTVADNRFTPETRAPLKPLTTPSTTPHFGRDIPSTSSGPRHQKKREPDGFPAANKIRELDPLKRRTPSTESSSAFESEVETKSSERSVGEELDNLQSELDKVLLGHFYAVTKPSSGVLRTREVAVLEKHNQLTPLPIDYHPIVRTSAEGPAPSHWVRPEDLMQQEKELMERMEESYEEVETIEEKTLIEEMERVQLEEEMQERDNKHQKEEEERRDNTSKIGETKRRRLDGVSIYDWDDDQDRGDFDVTKFKAVNVPKEEQDNRATLDIYSKATYRNYGVKSNTTVKDRGSDNTRDSSDLLLGHSPVVMDIEYDRSEEALLKDIESEF